MRGSGGLRTGRRHYGVVRGVTNRERVGEKKQKKLCGGVQIDGAKLIFELEKWMELLAADSS